MNQLIQYGLEHVLCSHILGISSSQLTNSYFSEGWPNHHHPNDLLQNRSKTDPGTQLQRSLRQATSGTSFFWGVPSMGLPQNGWFIWTIVSIDITTVKYSEIGRINLGFHESGYPNLWGKIPSRNGWWLGVPLWLGKPPFLKGWF